MLGTVFLGMISFGFSITNISLASEKKEKKFHCEKTVSGKIIDVEDVKNRKECKKKGGKWKKNDHIGHEGHSHNH